MNFFSDAPAATFRATGSLARPSIRALCVALGLVIVAVVSSGCRKKVSQETSSGPVLKWQFKSPSFGVSYPALTHDGTILFGASKGIYALSPEGKLLWQTTLASPGAPVLSPDGSFYVAISHGLLFGYSSEGKLTWQAGAGMIGFGAPPALGIDGALYVTNNVSDIFSFKPPQTEIQWNRDTFRENLLLNTPFLPGDARKTSHSAPVVARDQSILVPRQNWLHSLSSSGNEQWVAELSPGSLGFAALSEEGTTYVCDGASLYAVDPFGSKKWTFNDHEGCTVYGSPVLDAQGIVYFTGGDFLYAINPDGSLRWKTPGPGAERRRGTAFLTPPVIAEDGTVYIGAERYLYAIKPDGQIKWNLQVMTPTSAASIGPDGTIYFVCGYSWMCAARDSGSPLMHSAWPKQFHDPANTSSVLTSLP